MLLVNTCIMSFKAQFVGLVMFISIKGTENLLKFVKCFLIHQGEAEGQEVAVE